MRGDAIGARFQRHDRRAHRIGIGDAARVADGGDVIDVDAEPDALAHAARPRLPGLIAGSAASSGGN